MEKPIQFLSANQIAVAPIDGKVVIAFPDRELTLEPEEAMRLAELMLKKIREAQL